MAAITTSRICFIDTDLILEFAAENNLFVLGLCKQIYRQMFLICEKMILFCGKGMQGRLADALLYLSREVFHSDNFEVNLSGKEPGEMTNITTECVVRVIKELEDNGIIMADHVRIKITARKNFYLSHRNKYFYRKYLNSFQKLLSMLLFNMIGIC